MTNMYETFEELLNKLKDKYESQLHKNKELIKELEEYDKNEEIAIRDKQIEHLYKNSLFIMTNEELKIRKDFIERHNKLHNNGKVNLNGETYIYTITHTGIGGIIKIKCPICGEEIDITDIELL